jgi:Uma2 family endonuclease
MSTMETIANSGLEVYPLSVERYDQMVEADVLNEDDKVELLRGVLSAMTPRRDGHRIAVTWLNGVIVRGVDASLFTVGVQVPLRLPQLSSEPEPDVSVVPAGTFDRGGGTETAVLVIEVSDSSLARDLRVKVGIYAEVGIPELWIVDVPRAVMRVHRRPNGDRYQEVGERGSGTLEALEQTIPPIDLDELFAQLR